MAEEKKVKYYNPYPFPVRLKNDLDKDQVLAPQGHCKVKRNRCDQSRLDLLLWDQAGEKIYRPGLDMDLDKLLKTDLVNIAWAVMVGDRAELEGKSKRELVAAVREKVGMEEIKESNNKRDELEVASQDEKEAEVSQDEGQSKETPSDHKPSEEGDREG